MTTNVRKVFAIALVLVALVPFFVPAASAGTRQLWYICPDGPDGWLKKSPCGDGTQTIDEQYWWSAGAVECELSMGEGTWTLHLDYDAPSDGGTCYIATKHWSPHVGVPHETFTEVVGQFISGTVTTLDLDMVSTTTADFKVGDYFELVIQHWDPTTSGDLTVNCGSGKSTLRGPESDPGFPVPELSTLALYSVGLLALVGYVGYRRRER